MHSRLLKRLIAMQVTLNSLTLSCIRLNNVISKMINALSNSSVEHVMVQMPDLAESLSGVATNLEQFQRVAIGLTGDLNELQE